MMIRVLYLCAVVALVGLLHAARADVPPPPAWQSTLERDHPLVGRLWATDRGIFQPLDLLAREIVFEELVLLGEVHDNPDHHRLRAWAIDSARGVWSAPGGKLKPPAAVFEHIRAEDESRLAGLRSPDEVLDALQWEKSGWPDRAIFRPLFASVLAAGLAVRGGDASRDLVRRVARGGAGAMDDAERVRLGLDRPFAAGLQDALLTELEASHCGLMPKAAFGGMAEAQRLRDAMLADRLLAGAGTTGSAILFAGNGHVRTDRAAPLFARARAAGRKIVSVMIVEVEAGQTDPSAYVPRAPDSTPATDFIVFTPRTERPDPCVEMRKAMENRPKPP